MSQFRQTKSCSFLISAGAVAVALSVASCSQQQDAPAPAPSASASTTTTSASPVASAPTAASAPAVVPFAAFNGTVPVTVTNAQCSLDSINGQPAANASPAAAGSTITFSGWAGNGEGHPAANFVLLLKGVQQSYSVPLSFNFARPDVAKALKSPAMVQSGFNVDAKLSAVIRGKYAIYFADAANASSDCDSQRIVVVQ